MNQTSVKGLHELESQEVPVFLHYVVEAASPVCSDSHDERCLELLRERQKAEQDLVDRANELLLQRGGRPLDFPVPFAMSRFNFMRPVNLAVVLKEAAARDLDLVTELAGRYEGQEELEARLSRYLLADLAGVKQEHVSSVDKLLADIEAAKAADAAAAKGEVVETAEEESGEEAAGVVEEGDYPWHDEDLSLDERMELAKGKGKFEKLFAAMAQTDCTACGYDCEGYARAIADGEEKDLSKCAPGELETQEMLEAIMRGEA